MSSIDQERRIGVRGLNLGADPVQLPEGSLRVADGVRYVEDGAAHSRPGRVRAGLDFPNDGLGFDEQISHFRSPGPVRGFTTYYDTHVWPTDPPVTDFRIPERLNFLYKSNAQVLFNDHSYGDGSGVLDGLVQFRSLETRAKFVNHGDRVYIVDQSTEPKVFRRKPQASQTYQTRVKYDVNRMGIQWPTAGTSVPADLTQKPTYSTTVSTGNPVPDRGTYKFRIVLEDEYGIQSNPSMPVVFEQTASTAVEIVTVKWNTIVGTFPAAAVNVLVYVQITLAPQGTNQPASVEPSAYLYIGKNTVANGATGVNFTYADQVDVQNRGQMRLSNGAPPILSDLCVINDIAYGAARPSVIYRESTEGQAIQNSVVETIDYTYGYSGRRTWRSVSIVSKLLGNTRIEQTPVDASCLFWSQPGEPEYMETWIPIGNGTETIVALVPLGTTCVVLTDQGIYTFDAAEQVLRSGFARVGCLSRDAVRQTEQGIWFVATDGVPRLFNGATVSEVATELLPLFDRDDYQGDYQRLDRSNPQEIQAAYGDRKFFMLFPVSSQATQYKPGQSQDAGVPRYLAIGDRSRGSTRWSVDRSPSYDSIHWLGRESRLLGIERSGYFYFLEEGLTDQQTEGVADRAPYWEVATRWFSAGGVQAIFYKVKLDIDCRNQELTFMASVDGQTGLPYTETFSGANRIEKTINLPATFKGRFLDVRIFGFPEERVGVYGILPEVVKWGVF